MHPRTGSPLKSRGVGEGSICLCEPSPILRSYLRSPKFGLREDPQHRQKCAPAKASIGSPRCIVLSGLKTPIQRSPNLVRLLCTKPTFITMKSMTVFDIWRIHTHPSMVVFARFVLASISSDSNFTSFEMA